MGTNNARPAAATKTQNTPASPRRALSHKTRRALLTHAALIAISFVIALPLLFALIKSTQTNAQIFSYPPTVIPGHAAAQNYRAVWTQYGFGRLMFNSLVLAVSVTILKILLSLLAALAIVYFVFPLRQAFFLFVLFTLMLPVPILVVPLFAFFSSLHWINTYQGLILPFIASATGVLLFRQHFLSIPTSLVDAARMDGAGPFRFLRDVLVPMSMNTIGAMAVIEFIYVWNQYLWPLLATTSQDMGVVQLGIHMLAGTGSQSDWGLIMAGVVIAALPPLAVFLMLQEQFMRGFALSRSK